MRLRLLGDEVPQLRAFLRTGASDSSDSERGALVLAQGWATPVISPRTSLRLSVEFQRFLMALSVLYRGQAGIRLPFLALKNWMLMCPTMTKVISLHETSPAPFCLLSKVSVCTAEHVSWI